MDATTMSVIFGMVGLFLVLCNPSNNNTLFCPSMMKAPCACHVGLLSHCQWINGQRQHAQGGTQFGNAECHDEHSLPTVLFIVVNCHFFVLSSM
jgi:hypothetical protein